jgi:hypothetical protein
MNWTQVGVFAAIVLLIFMCGVTILPFLVGGYGGWGNRASDCYCFLPLAKKK